jgi:RNA polymerase sigma-70 factor, ECF subfamily
MEPQRAPQAMLSFPELLQRARQGSSEALGQLLNDFRFYLLQLALEEVEPELRVKDAPSDLMQKSFLEASQGFAQFAGATVEEFKGWLRNILRHNVHDARERYQAAKRDLSREVGTAGELAQAATEPSPSNVAIEREQAAALSAGLAQLSPANQELLRLRHAEGHTFAMIAKKLGVTEEAARKRWARAVEELRMLVSGDPSSSNGRGVT